MKPDPTERFSKRVEHYVRSRPSYPPEILETLTHRAGLTREDRVADIGSGTGKLSELFLKHGNRVIGVEPNGPMREAGKRLLSRYDRFTCIDGKAEETGLPDRSADIVAAGQAFHWFDPEKTRREFSRVLAPGGRIVLVWNNRLNEGSPFMQAYERTMREHGTDYQEVNHHRLTDEEIGRFFGKGGCGISVHANRHILDLEGLEGRVLSCSYMPDEGEPGHAAMLEAVKRLFSEHSREGRVVFEYETRMYYTQIPGRAA